jgi:predicted nucleic acid-binding protein
VRVFIDSNIAMYAAGRAHPHRDPSQRFLRRVQSGEVEGCTSTEVLQEILYRYAALRLRDVAAKVYDLFVEVCPVVFDVTLADTDLARALLVEVGTVSARDAVHAAVMRNRGVGRIVSYDAGFDDVPGLERVPPG